MERGDHRSEAEDDPRLLAESVGVGVAGVDGGELGCGRRGSVVHGNVVGARRRAKQGARDALRGLTDLLDSPG